MDTSQDMSLCHWLKRYQGLDRTERQVADAAQAVEEFSKLIGDLAEDLPFDTDPAAYDKLLRDLAPDEVK